MENRFGKKKIILYIVGLLMLCALILFFLFILCNWALEHRYILKGDKIEYFKYQDFGYYQIITPASKTQENIKVTVKKTDLTNQQTIEQEYVMVNDTLFVCSDEECVSKIPNSYTNIGTVSKNNIYQLPSFNFEASWIYENTPIYANPESYSILYIPITNGKYKKYVPAS